ncbi:hypothetical protein [Entomohabitans teleogrylli]|uniref:hypothetical protein n=1 Tax=Entomohabitans teleogrylli TaxID=1384589 RepID=UPI002012AF04|nr:hypothetical protein [Entomohabitans teleogrylli]
MLVSKQYGERNIAQDAVKAQAKTGWMHASNGIALFVKNTLTTLQVTERMPRSGADIR